MASKQPQRPTDAELAILRVLWDLGEGTVREVHAALARSRDVGQTTILKQLQIMTEKGLVRRDDGTRPAVYRPHRSQNHTQKQLVRDLLERAFAGSPAKLVLQALPLEKASPEERERIRELLDQLEEEGR
ncbi:MAG TPA: BlaI/MecI/CopY family transcriptional regulator [Planctomycetota bacterium]